MQHVRMVQRRLRYGDIRKNKSGPKVNFYIGLLIIILILFLIRLVSVLSSNKERGGLAYVQLLNIGAPIIETQIYDEGIYAENRLSLANVLLEVVGLNHFTYDKVISNELSLFNVTGNMVNESDSENKNKH